MGWRYLSPTKDGGLNPNTFKINRLEENWNKEVGYAAWQSNDFSRRARAACETIIYMPCTIGKYEAGKFIKYMSAHNIHGKRNKYKHDTMNKCQVLIDAAKGAGYQLMIVDNNWAAVPNVFDIEKS